MSQSMAFALPTSPLAVCLRWSATHSDGGLCWLAEADTALGLCAALAPCIPEWRRGHGAPLPGDLGAPARLPDRLWLRGSERCRHLAHRSPAQAGLRAPARARPTWPASPPSRAWRMRWIGTPAAGWPCALAGLSAASGSRTACRTASCWTSTAPTIRRMASRKAVAYHGYYGQHMYHPLLVFDGDTDQLITALLRPGNCPRQPGRRWRRCACWSARSAPAGRRSRSRSAPTAAAPSPASMPICEGEHIAYTIGLIPNSRLEAVAAPLLAQAPAQQRARPARRCAWSTRTATRPAAGSTERRVVYKAEALDKGPNTRFVVTTRNDPPAALYDLYIDRGKAEIWIKDLKRACFADRLSCHRFWANQFRLLLHAAAYWLLDTLRRWLVQPQGARISNSDTLRLRLLKIGGRVRQRLDGIRPILRNRSGSCLPRNLIVNDLFRLADWLCTLRGRKAAIIPLRMESTMNRRRGSTEPFERFPITDSSAPRAHPRPDRA